MPLAWFAKRQRGSANSTPEAETVSMAEGARMEAIPIQGLMELMLDRLVRVEVGEDNTATISAIKKGYSVALRYLVRQQQVSLGGLHDLFTDPPPPGCGKFELKYRETATHKGDVFTKPLPPASFLPAVERLGLRSARLPLPDKHGYPVTNTSASKGGAVSMVPGKLAKSTWVQNSYVDRLMVVVIS